MTIAMIIAVGIPALFIVPLIAAFAYYRIATRKVKNRNVRYDQYLWWLSGDLGFAVYLGLLALLIYAFIRLS